MQQSEPRKLETFIKAVRAGLIDPVNPWTNEYAKKAGWNPPTPEQNKRLAELELKLSNPELSVIERADIIEQMMGVYRQIKLPPPILTSIAANFVATNLTGIKTIIVNIFGPMARMMTERVLHTVGSPQNFYTIWKPVTEAFSNFLHEVRYGLEKDAYTFVNNEFSPASNELKRVWERNSEILKNSKSTAREKSVAVVKMLFGSQQYFMRALNSIDNANMVTEREVQLALYGSTAFRDAGLGTADVKALVQSVGRLKRTAFEEGIAKGLDAVTARARADAIAAEQVQAFIGDRVGDTIAADAAKSAEMDAYSAIGRLGKNVSERDEGGLLSRIILHPLLDVSTKLRSGDGSDPILAVSLLGYLNVPLRTARFYAWNSPYGLFRLGINKYRKSRGLSNWWEQSLATEMQERQRLKLALTATFVQTMLLGAGYALLRSSANPDQDEDFSIHVTGQGPKSKLLRDQWVKTGFKPNSIIVTISGKKVVIPLTRVGESLSHIFWPLSARDDYQWRKKEAETSGKEFKETWTQEVGHAVGTYAALLGQRGLLQNISQWGNIAAGRGGVEKPLASTMSSLIASATMPYLGMQRTINGIVNGQIDRSSVESAITANFPVLGAFGEKFQHPAVNRYGDKLGDRTWFGQVAGTGLPLAFQVADTPENQKMYSILASKGVAPPELRRYVLEEKYGPLTDEQFAQFARKSGDVLKKDVLNTLNWIKTNNSTRVKTWLASRRIARMVRRQLLLDWNR